MPKQLDIKTQLKQSVYIYLVSKGITYEEGAMIFGFNSKQAFHAWIQGAGTTPRDEMIHKKLTKLTR